jgi:hypothetical protein
MPLPKKSIRVKDWLLIALHVGTATFAGLVFIAGKIFSLQENVP